MFVINQNNDAAEKMKSVSYYVTWSNKARKELNDIEDRIAKQVYYYGTTEKCYNAIDVMQDRYKIAHLEEKRWILSINGNNYGIFKSEEEVKKEYENVINALESGVVVYRIPEINESEGNNGK